MCCYVCGRQCLLSSWEMHEQGCIKKWHETEAAKPPGERRPLPKKPELGEGATLEEKDAAAQQAYNNDAMSACPGCGRKFAKEESLAKHMKGCDKAAGMSLSKPAPLPPMAGGGGGGGGGLGGSMGEHPGGKREHSKPAGPRSMCCYICGRQCLLSSWEMHEQGCIKKWHETEAAKPPGERRPLPKKPELGEGATLEEKDAAAQQAYNNDAMSACPGCGRKFAKEESLAKHMKGCDKAAGMSLNKDPPPRPMSGGGGPDGGEGSSKRDRSRSQAGPRSMCCYICGRQCLISSWDMHEQACIKKWEETESAKPPGQRRPLPTKPELGEGASLQERDAAAQQAYNAEGMSACPGCGRSFAKEESLAKHMKGCDKAHGMTSPNLASSTASTSGFGSPGGGPSSSSSSPSKSPGGGGGGPKSMCCYICGMQCLMSSWPMHEKACIKKFEEAEANKPPGQRRPLPQKPDLGAGASRAEMDAAAQQVYQEQAMFHCEGCGRSFASEASLGKHAKACNGRPAGGGRLGASSKESNRPGSSGSASSLLARSGQMALHG